MSSSLSPQILDPFSVVSLIDPWVAFSRAQLLWTPLVSHTQSWSLLVCGCYGSIVGPRDITSFYLFTSVETPGSYMQIHVEHRQDTSGKSAKCHACKPNLDWPEMSGNLLNPQCWANQDLRLKLRFINHLCTLIRESYQLIRNNSQNISTLS